MNLLLAFDGAMIAPLAACLRSISISNDTSAMTVYLAHGLEPSDKRLAKLSAFCDAMGFRAVFIHVGSDEFETIRSQMPSGHVSAAGLYRCKMASLLPSELDRVLYLDCDTIVVGSLAPLYESDLGGNLAITLRTPLRHLEDLGVSRDSYFNSGVMLVDLRRWRAENTERAIFDILESIPERLDWWDQCALNIALNGKTAPLERKFNYIFRHTDIPEKFELPVVIHYAGGEVKPWDRPLRHPWGGIYIEMSSRTPFHVSLDTSADAGVPLLRRIRRSALRELGLRK